MCGVVALVGEVPPAVTAAAVVGAAARGPHSHGWAVPSATGWDVVRYSGRLTTAGMPTGALVVIGHSRLATSTRRPGDAPSPEEGQPIVAGSIALAHNGTLSPGDIADLGQDPATVAVDTAAVAAALARTDRSPSDAFGVLRLACTAPQAVIWADADGLYAGRVTGVRVAAHPLYVEETPGYLAVSSAPLPAGRLLPADEAHLLWSF